MSTHKLGQDEYVNLEHQRREMFEEALTKFFRVDATQERLSYIGFEIHIVEDEK